MVSRYLNTFSKIILANPTLSLTTQVSLGDGWLMFSSRERRTAAMIEAAMTMVDEKRSRVRASSSLAVARFISPMR